jgi:hypothetical protein
MRRNVLRGATAALCLLAGSFAACGDDTGGAEAGTGKVTFTTWGEEYIEQQIPAEELADGWSVKYSKFLVFVGNIRVGDKAGAEAARKDGFFLINHVTPGVKPLVSFDGIEAKSWDRVSYEVRPVTDASQVELVGGATEADRDAMITNACHLFVEGTLSKSGEDSKTFSWCLGLPTLLDDCQGEIDGKLTPGAVVTEGGEDQIELTIHGDHLFYDNLQSPDALVKAQVYVDSDGADGSEPDGEITLAELEAVDLDDLPPDAYGTGSATGIENLRDYITFSSRTVGHYRGEGECFVKDPG